MTLARKGSVALVGDRSNAALDRELSLEGSSMMKMPDERAMKK